MNRSDGRGAVPDDPDQQLFESDSCCAWTIIHEASHKFARTRDFGLSGYDFNGCRQLHWQHAVRNAKHHEMFAALAWDRIPWGEPTKSSGFIATSRFSARNIDFYGLPGQ